MLTLHRVLASSSPPLMGTTSKSNAPSPKGGRGFLLLVPPEVGAFSGALEDLGELQSVEGQSRREVRDYRGLIRAWKTPEKSEDDR